MNPQQIPIQIGALTGPLCGQVSAQLVHVFMFYS